MDRGDWDAFVSYDHGDADWVRTLAGNLDALADALYELDASDPALDDMDLTTSLTAGPLVVSMTVDADDMESALHKALVTFRSALLQIGRGTPGWEQATASMAVRLASSPRLVA